MAGEGDVTVPPCSGLPAYSAFFLRRSTMIPKNRTASTAHTIRTVEVSIVLSPFQTRVNSAFLVPTFRQVLDAIHHRYQLTDDLHRHRSYGHNEQGRQDAKEDRKNQFHAQLGGFFFGHLARLNAHEIGMRAEALGHAGSEP